MAPSTNRVFIILAIPDKTENEGSLNALDIRTGIKGELSLDFPIFTLYPEKNGGINA
jgi:hypothetical protein